MGINVEAKQTLLVADFEALGNTRGRKKSTSIPDVAPKHVLIST
jgi:hypothetical protein